MSLGSRLQLFIINSYKSQSVFANLVNIKDSALSRYIKNKSYPTLLNLKKFHELGVSLNWLIADEGAMFADNENGKKLSKIYCNNNYKDKFCSRFIEWINDNFYSLEDFCSFFEIESSYLENVFYNNILPDSNFVKFIEKTGCNYKWVYSGSGSKFNSTPTGKILRFKNIGLEYLIEYINSISYVNFNSKNITSKYDIMIFIKTAIEIESSIEKLNDNILINITSNLN